MNECTAIFMYPTSSKKITPSAGTSWIPCNHAYLWCLEGCALFFTWIPSGLWWTWFPADDFVFLLTGLFSSWNVYPCWIPGQNASEAVGIDSDANLSRRSWWRTLILMPASHADINEDWNYNSGSWLLTLITKSCHDGNFVIIGGTAGCHYDNLLCHQ